MNSKPAIDVFIQKRQPLLQDLFAFLRFPTISAQSQHAPDVQACAQWIRDQLVSAGLKVEIIPTAGHPVVFADTGPVSNPSAPALLFYGHYDVQPIGDAKLWTSPA